MGYIESQLLYGVEIQYVFDRGNSSSVTASVRRFLGMYWRSKPMKFSLMPRCQLQYRSEK
jgi:hypothetical protein